MTSAAESARYRVGMVARLTGLSTHTLRMWEKRYAAVVPDRTPAGGRLYDDENVERLALLKRLTDRGHSIGTIAKLGTPELERMERVSSKPFRRAEPPQLVEEFIASVTSFDVGGAEQILGRASISLGPHELIDQVVNPILERVGELWEAGEMRIVHQHIACTCIRSLVISLTRTYPKSNARRVVVATPSGERHEFGILTVALLAAAHGWELIYLGADLPAEEIVFAANEAGVDAVMLSLVNESEQNEQQVGIILDSLNAGIDVVFGGRGAPRFAETRAKILGSVGDLERYLR